MLLQYQTILRGQCITVCALVAFASANVFPQSILYFIFSGVVEDVSGQDVSSATWVDYQQSILIERILFLEKAKQIYSWSSQRLAEVLFLLKASL